MQLRDSRRAAEDLANELDVVDDQALDTLRADEMFAAWAYIYQQADLYAADVEETLAEETGAETSPIDPLQDDIFQAKREFDDALQGDDE